MSETELLCEAPAHAQAEVIVDLSGEGFKSVKSGVQYRFVPEPFVTSLSPRSGPSEGKTVVSVRGYNFVDSSMLVCVFGSVHARARWISSSEVSCIAPAGGDKDEVNVSVSLNGIDHVQSTSSFQYMPEVSLVALQPSHGAARGGTTVRIEGSNFVFSSELACRFGISSVAARYINAGEVRCVTPPLEVGNVAVSVSNNGIDFSSSSLVYTGETDVTISEFWPVRCSTFGGCAVMLSGSGFTNSSSLECRFGGIPALKTVFESESVVRCEAPAQVEGEVDIEITSNGVDVASAGPVFQYVADALVTSISPRTGPNSGGTSVLVNGHNFIDSKDLRCQFGNKSVLGRWLSASRLECIAPSHHIEAGAVSVRVSLNGADFTVSSKDFEYAAALSVAAVHPAVGPSSGGTEVTVSGSHFVHTADLVCRIGHTEVAASFVSDSEVRCTTPVLAIGPVDITVSSNGLDFSNGVEFTSTADAMILAVTPPLGPSTGGTAVTVSGQGFMNSSELACHFDGIAAPWTRFVSETEVLCEAPVHESGAVFVEIFLDAMDRIKSAASFMFVYPPRITRFAPSSGPSSGGTLVQLSGYNFVNTEQLVCRFGTIDVPGRWTSSTSIQCVTPKTDTEETKSEVALSLNGMDFSQSGFFYEWLEVSTLKAMTPTRGPSTGGTDVYIESDRFIFSSKLGCRFGLVDTPASFVNSTHIRCTVPSLPTGVVSLSVTSNGVDYSDEPLQFEIEADVFVNSISPSSGAVPGRTEILVHGTGFENRTSLNCWFGDMLSPSATFLNATAVSCISPPALSRQLSRVTVSNDGVNRAMSRAYYEYLDLASIASLSPSAGPISGGTVVLVYGYSFADSTSLRCFFGETFVKALWISSELIECVTPAQDATLDTVLRVGTSEADLSNAMPFRYIPAWHASSISPVSGTEAGGSQVTISGDGFSAEITWTCWFGVVPVAALPVNASKLVCLAPQYHAGLIEFGVSAAGSPRSTVAGGYEYMPTVSVRTVFPTMGSTTGGTLVNVTLSAAMTNADALSCLFGEVPVPVVSVENNQSLFCYSPASLEGDVAISAHTNENQFESFPSAASFSYRRPPSVFHVHPQTALAHESVLVTVTGANFASASSLVCRFGEQEVVGHWLSTNSMECPSPNHTAGIVPFAVSNNALDFEPSAETFRFVPVMTLHSLSSSNGSTDGGSSLSVFGTNMPSDVELYCAFGNELTDAAFLSSSEVVCLTPRAHFGGSIAVRLCYHSGLCSQNSLAYDYVWPSTIDTIAPVAGSTSGGTLVAVTGSGFTESSACLFGDVRVPGIYTSESHLICQSPAAQTKGAVLFAVSADGVAFTSNRHTFTYYPVPTAIDVYPTVVSELGGSSIHVYGANFFNTESLACSFDGGRDVAPARWISSTQVACVAPSHKPGPVSLHVENTPNATSASEIRIMFASVLVVQSIAPDYGTLNGGTKVVIRGTNFDENRGMVCRFGVEIVNAFNLNRTAIACTAPASTTTGAVDVALSQNGVDFVDAGGRFLYVDSVVISEVSPRLLDLRGGERVVVHGSGFLPKSGFPSLCRIGDTFVATTLVSPSVLYCDTPEAPPGFVGDVRLSLWSATEQRVASTSIILGYAKPALIEETAVAFARTTGNTAIVIYGSNFVGSPELVCQFGNTQPVAAKWHSSFQIQCATPSHAPGIIPLRVSNNNLTFSDEVSFEFVEQVSILSIAPRRGSTAGGTVVTVAGTNFKPSWRLSCEFGGVLSAASYVNPTTVRCRAPALPAGPVKFRLTNNGVDFAEDLPSPDGAFVYSDQDIVIKRLRPDYGDVAGGTNVTVEGSGFPMDMVSCRFGTSAPTRGVPISDIEAVCMSPINQRAVSVPVELSWNNFEFSSSGKLYKYVNTPSMVSAVPSSGGEEGGTSIQIKGLEFLNTPDLSCRFGSSIVNASWISPSELRCVSPPAAPGRVGLQISINGQDFVQDALHFTFLPRLQVARMVPSAGVLYGGTTITIYGSGFSFSSVLACRFNKSIDIPATYIDEQSIRCNAPQIAQPALMPLEVTFNGYDFSMVPGSFMFVEPPQVTEVKPLTGPLVGGVTVAVLGRGMFGDMACKFGAIEVPSFSLGAEDMERGCDLPPSQVESDVDFCVVFNASYEVCAGRRFLYTPEVQLLSVVPPNGPSDGGNTLTLLGSNFVNTPHLSCRVGGMMTSAKWLSAHEILCSDIPAASVPGLVEIQVSADGKHYVGGLPYTYKPTVKPISLEPTSGPSSGGTLVTIKGSNFENSGVLTCAFGVEVVPASFVDKNTISCITPEVSDSFVVNVTIR